MAKIRTIKPEFWDDVKLAELPMQARLVFIGSWNFADDFGVFLDSVKWLKGKIFPYDTIRDNEILSWVDALVKNRMLVPFAFNGKGYYVIRRFRSHQLIDKRYERSILDVPGLKVLSEMLETIENTECSQCEPIVNTSLYMEVEVEKKERVVRKPKTKAKDLLEKRQKEFYDSLAEYVVTYGKDMIRAFYDYWREPNRSKTKMKWEREPTWELSLRLKKWEKNEYQFSKGKTNETQVSGVMPLTILKNPA